MSDLVFSCPTCRRPLVVEEASAGSAVRCPLCRTTSRIPIPKTAVVRRSRDSLLSRVERQRRRMRGLAEEVGDLIEGFDSSFRLGAELEEDGRLLREMAETMRMQLEVIGRQVGPRVGEERGGGAPRRDQPDWLRAELVGLLAGLALLAGGLTFVL